MKKSLLLGLIITGLLSVNCSYVKRASCNGSASVAEDQAVQKCLDEKNKDKKEDDKIKEDAVCSAAGSAAREASYNKCMQKI
jgi:hypothetical protein